MSQPSSVACDSLSIRIIVQSALMISGGREEQVSAAGAGIGVDSAGGSAEPARLPAHWRQAVGGRNQFVTGRIRSAWLLARRQRRLMAR